MTQQFKYYARSTGVRAVAYLVSDTDGSQRSAIDAWCKQTAVTVVQYFSDDCPPTTPLKRRPGLMQALYEPHLQTLDFVLVARRSLVAIKALSFLTIDRVLRRKKCRLFAIEHSEPPVELAGLHKLHDSLDEYVKYIESMRLRGMTYRRRELGEFSAERQGYKSTKRGRAVLAYVSKRVSEGASMKIISQELNKGLVGKPLRGRWWTADAVRHALASARKK